MISIDGGKPETYADVRGAMLSQVIEQSVGLNEAKRSYVPCIRPWASSLSILKSNVAELHDLARMASELNVCAYPGQQRPAYTEEMREEVLYGYEPCALQSQRLGAGLEPGLSWATLELPRMHWGAERRCRFVQDRSIVVGWDGSVSPCYALSHNYSLLRH